MDQKTIVIAAVLAAALLSGIFSTTPLAVYAEDNYDDEEHDDGKRDYDMDNDDGDGRDNDNDEYKGGDESETNTEQKLKQENDGSGASTNFNCGENSIDSGLIDAQLCGTVDVDLGRVIGIPTI